MAQASIVVANNPGATVRAAINDAFEAITTHFSGTSAPSPTYPFMRWADTTNGVLKVRNSANTAWNLLRTITFPLTREVSTATTIALSDLGKTVNGNATGGAFTITLPTAVGNTGFMVTLRKSDSSSNAVTIDGDGAETIDGATTLALTAQYDVVGLISDGTAWRVLYLRTGGKISLAAAQTWAAPQRPQLLTGSIASSQDTDFGTTQNYQFTVDTSATMNAPTVPAAAVGQTGTMTFIRGSTGGSLAWNANFVPVSGDTLPTEFSVATSGAKIIIPYKVVESGKLHCCPGQRWDS